MKMPITNNTIIVTMRNCLALVCLLFLAACDGGIFGTGSSPDEIIPIDQSIAGTPPTDLSMDLESSTITDGDTAGTVGETTTAGDTSTSGDSGTEGDTEATTGDPVPPTSQGPESSSAGDSATPTESQIVAGGSAQFTNNTITLTDGHALLRLVNTSTVTANLFETTVEPDLILFDAAGVAPGAQSAVAILTNNESSLIIVDNNNVGEALFTYDLFNAANGTVSTVFVSQSNNQLTSLALDTQTNTTDPTLAKVRIVQVTDLGDATTETQLQLQSAGANPGGQDTLFEPISINTPNTAYVELAAGDYELVDLANRLATTPISFVGSNAYTIVLPGLNAEDIFIINDTSVSN